MAQLSIPQPRTQERISQILPTVKCSNCNQSVPLAELGEHTCAPPPPLPRPSPSQAILAKIRRGSQSGRSSQIPPQPAPPQSTPPLPPNVPGLMTSPIPRSQTPMSVRSKTPQPRPTPTVVVPPPHNIENLVGIMGRQRSPGPIRSQTPQMPPPSPRMPNASPAPRFDTLPRSATPQSRPGIMIPTTPQKPGPLSAPGVVNGYPSSNPNVAQHSSPRSRPSADRHPSARPSMDRPPPTRPSMDRPPSARPSFDLPPPARPSLDKRRPSMDSVRSAPPPNVRMPGNRLAGGNASPQGEVNMAGVGRRGFQAAAQAAMLATSLGQNVERIRSPPNGMDGKRTNAPKHLNINPSLPSQQGMISVLLAPPKSFDETSANKNLEPSSSLSPNTPHSYSPYSPSPNTPNSYSQPGIVSSRTPSPTSLAFSALQLPVPPKTPESMRSVTPDTIRSLSPGKSALAARLNSLVSNLEVDTSAKEKKLETVPTKQTPLSPSGESDYSGLAYDQESEPVLSPTSPPTSLPTSRSETNLRSRKESSERIIFPTRGSPPQPLVGLPTRSVSSGSSYSYSSRTTSKSTSALDRSLETVFEGSRSPPVPVSPPLKSPKLPIRSRTTPAISTTKSENAESPRQRPKQCTRCAKKIEDGRWVKAEGAGVLCERCWKTMYLPKCRRCNRPIEKQAVSSADGQLKGKYHRECFNCHKCHQPFPDKEFYVFDGKPYCRYHYHEANDSLCADPACGQPIEGPCAVAHTGERYHPEHLLCQYEYPTKGGERGARTRCQEQLTEYWEVDGLMLCEKHAMAPPMVDDDDDSYESSSHNHGSDAETRALRRKTQFIDLR